jgi:hypothetical protein
MGRQVAFRLWVVSHNSRALRRALSLVQFACSLSRHARFHRPPRRTVPAVLHAPNRSTRGHGAYYERTEWRLALLRAMRHRGARCCRLTRSRGVAEAFSRDRALRPSHRSSLHPRSQKERPRTRHRRVRRAAAFQSPLRDSAPPRELLKSGSVVQPSAVHGTALPRALVVPVTYHVPDNETASGSRSFPRPAVNRKP